MRNLKVEKRANMYMVYDDNYPMIEMSIIFKVQGKNIKPICISADVEDEVEEYEKFLLKHLQTNKIQHKDRSKAWQYMRRNKHFRVGDVMMITDIKEQNLRVFLRGLLRSGHIKKAGNQTSFREKIYALIRDTGIHTPTGGQR